MKKFNFALLMFGAIGWLGAFVFWLNRVITIELVYLGNTINYLLYGNELYKYV